MPKDIFTGPEDLELLQGAVAEGWTVSSATNSLVTFHYPLPILAEEHRIDFEVANDMYSQDFYEGELVGVDRKRSEDLGGYTAYLAISSMWPISTELVLYLDDLGKRILEVSEKS